MAETIALVNIAGKRLESSVLISLLESDIGENSSEAPFRVKADGLNSSGVSSITGTAREITIMLPLGEGQGISIRISSNFALLPASTRTQT